MVRLMAEYRGKVFGNRGVVTRLGSKNSGITSNLNSHKLNCESSITYNKQEDIEEVHIIITEYGSGKLLQTFKYKSDGN